MIKMRIDILRLNSAVSGAEGIVMASTLFLMVFLGILLSAAFLRLNIELDGTEGQSKTMTTFFVADAGLEETISRLRTSPNWRGGFADVPLSDIAGNTVGYYTVAFGADINDYPWVRIPATCTGRLNLSDTEYSRAIYAEILTASPASFFVFTPDRAVISNGANIQNGSLYAREIEFSICPVYPNDLIINQPTFYLSKYTINDPNGTNSPNVILTETPTQLSKPPVFPSIDARYYRELAQDGGSYYDGNQTFDGISIEEGHNGVIFVEGDVYIKGEIQDPVVVVSGGDTYITGDITWLDDGESNPIGKLGLFSKGDIYIAEGAPQDINIRAQLIADGGVFEALGEKGSKNNLTFKGSMAIKGGRGREYGAVDLTVYGNRTYNYDASLLQPPALPYVTYIAYLDFWKEVACD